MPNRISCLSDLLDFPVITKRVIQNSQGLIFQSGKIKRDISTGGSTGEPVRFPVHSKDAVPVYADMYVGRSWYGIEPLDRMLLFWGHSHLFGTGLKGVLNTYKRRFYDYLLDVKRLNAYDMSHQTISQYYDIYRQTKPSVILGYTSCLYKLAK